METALLDHFVDMHKEIVGTGREQKVYWKVDCANDSRVANGWESRLSYWEKRNECAALLYLLLESVAARLVL